MNDTNFHLRKLEKEDQNKSKSEDKEKIKTKAEENFASLVISLKRCHNTQAQPFSEMLHGI